MTDHKRANKRYHNKELASVQHPGVPRQKEPGRRVADDFSGGMVGTVC
jgi:hypothetical protein